MGFGRRPRFARRAVPLLACCGALAMPPASGAQTPGIAEVIVVPNGRGAITLSTAGLISIAEGSQNERCAGSASEEVRCVYNYVPGAEVTFTAAPYAAGDPNPADGPANFVAWSDYRCPPGPSCTLALTDGGQAITAIFNPQRVSVRYEGTGSVTSNPAPLEPGGYACDGETCSGSFPVFTRVELTPSGSAPQWDVPRCDNSPVGPTCVLVADRPRWGGLSFDGAPLPLGIPPNIDVRFRVRKEGDGSGDVSGGVDCGARCTVDLPFGRRISLVARADRGSRFVRWRGACSSDDTCALAVGPVTTVGAVFASASAASREERRQSRRAFVARVRRIAVRGRGRRRVIVIRVGVNAPATVRAALVRGRRQVASRRWRLRSGTRVLRLRVPARTRAGVYRLRLTIRDSTGQTRRVARSVRLRR